MQEKLRNVIKRINNFATTKAKVVSYNKFLGVLIGLALTIFIIDTNASAAYMVKVKDKTIGYTESKKEYKKVVDSIKETDEQDIITLLTIEKATNQPVEFLSGTELERMVRQELKLSMPAVAMFADGVEIVKVDSVESMDKVIKGVQEYYYPKVQDGTYTITSTEIKEKITTSTVPATNPEEILSVEKAVEKIVSGQGKKKTYTIVQNDTTWDIAIKNGISIEEIEEANPGVNLEKLKIGQEINLAVNIPYLSVEITANIKAKETIPYDTDKVLDKALAKGSSKVKQEGKDGIAEVEKNIIILNSDVIQEDVIESKLITPAVNKVVVEGEKEKVVVASGNFMRPSRGTLTSGYGQRWGRQHKGVDLAGPTGTPIYAADGGTVTLAGRNGGYGLCIIINHGNGYQTLYGHASKLLVKAGQKVSKGERIANVGSTGRSTGPHLHFEVRKNGVNLNPLRFIK